MRRNQDGFGWNEEEPEKCERCPHNVLKGRYEDYGDVDVSWCDLKRKWLDLVAWPPCEPKPADIKL